MKTNDLAKCIRGTLLEYCDNVYRNRAIKNAPYPHIVFMLHDTIDFPTCDYTCEIDVFSKSADGIEDIADAIEQYFLCRHEVADTISYVAFTERNIFVEEEDKEIFHKNLEIQIRLYERN